MILTLKNVFKRFATQFATDLLYLLGKLKHIKSANNECVALECQSLRDPKPIVRDDWIQ